MSEDARVAKGRRVLYIANPGSDSEGSEDGPSRIHAAQHAYTHPLRPNRQSPKCNPPLHHQPAPLTTNLPSNHVSHHSSHPSLSSPSSTSSPAAEESTPPPSTPGLPIPPVDLSSDGPVQEPFIASHNTDRHITDGQQITMPSRKGKFLQTLKSPFQSHSRQRPTIDAPLKRPRTSPTVSTPDSYNSNSAVSDKVLIVVTTDSDWYVTVDISSAKSAAVIRECIFNKLNILDDDQLHFSIYQTEMGAFAIGDALTDEKLFSLCRDQGDTKGSLKFFVSHSSATVHEPPVRPRSPTAVTIPPPVLPYNANYLPLQPKRRSKQESISSASEQHPLETSAGYEADLDNPEREAHRTAVHPSPPVPTFVGLGNPPPSPQNTRRPNVPIQPSIPRPLPNTSPSSDSVSGPAAESVVEKPKQFVSPPPLSPNRPNFSHDDDSLVPPVNRSIHGRSGSDAGAEREQALKATEQQMEIASKQWRIRQPQMSSGRLKTEPSRENLLSKEARRKRYQNDLSEPWVVVPSSGPHTNDQDVSPPAQDLSRATAQAMLPSSRQPSSPARYNKPQYGTRALAIPSNPRQAPPAVPIASNDTRATPHPARVPLPPHSVVSWRGEERGDQKSGPPRRLNKGAKSMDNLRASSFVHPATLQPGGARRPPQQLPMTRPTAGVREQIPFSSVGSSSGLTKPCETQRLRPLPVQGSSHSGALDFGQASYLRGVQSGTLTSSREPYPRPQSALGESLPSPTQQYSRQQQSPTYSNIGDTGESVRSPRAVSPSRPYYARSKPDAVYASRTGTSFDNPGVVETSNATPPRTPVSPRSSHRTGGEKSGSGGGDTLPNSGSGTNHSSTSSEQTLKQEDQELFLNFLAQNSEATLVPPVVHATETVPRPRSPPLSPSPGEMSRSGFRSQYEDESDSGGDDCGTSIWKKPPMAESNRPKSILRPPLKVQISSSSATQQQNKTVNGDSQHTTFAPPPIPPVPPIPSSYQNIAPRSLQGRPSARGMKGVRGSTFTEMQDSTWAPRPPPEDVYERLEEFFPEHDLDKPLIEASSGGTSPTTADAPAALAPLVPVPPDKTSRIKWKKSIRIVAQEHKKLIDRTSRGDSSSFSVLRKRSTKLWGSKVEEVTTAQAKAHGSSTLPESSPGGPTTFKWVRGELIGRGTYGRVYLALNATTGEMIAVKQVETPQTASDKNDSRQISVVQALKLESETLKDLDHPNIVQYLGFEETPSNLSIFLEYVPGGSIGSCLLKHGKFDEDVTKSFTAQILGGLEYLHSKGILHRDLKADNILVEMSGICKISDFGISKRTDDGSGGAFTAMQGTVFWMAPEVINTQKKGYNFKIDIWSVGCVVLEMWAGMRPWMGDEVVAVMFKLYQSKLPPPVPEDVVLSDLADDFRRKCFAINPEERPTAAELRRHRYLELPPDWVFNGF